MTFALIVAFFAALVQGWDVYHEVHEKRYGKHRMRIEIGIRVALIILLIMVSIFEVIDKRKQAAIAATYGEFGKQKDCPASDPYVRFGNNFSMTGIRGSLFGFTGQYTSVIKAASDNNQIAISAYIRDGKGDMVASINGRKWEVASPPQGIDYNNDDSAFEVVTPDYRVIAQFVLKKDTLIYNGLLCSESGTCILCTKEGISILNASSAPQRFFFPETYDVKPIFKYPRRDFLHVRETENQ